MSWFRVPVAVSEGKTLFFLASNWSTSTDGSWAVMRVMLHESFWFSDNATTSAATTYDLQGDFCLVWTHFHAYLTVLLA